MAARTIRSTIALNALHGKQSLFSYGISDTPNGIALYPVGSGNRRPRHRQAGQDAIAAALPRKCRASGSATRSTTSSSSAGFNRHRCDRLLRLVQSRAARGEQRERRQSARDPRPRCRRRPSPSKRWRWSDHFNFLDSLQTKQAAAAPGAPAAPAAPSPLKANAAAGPRELVSPRPATVGPPNISIEGSALPRPPAVRGVRNLGVAEASTNRAETAVLSPYWSPAASRSGLANRRRPEPAGRSTCAGPPPARYIRRCIVRRRISGSNARCARAANICSGPCPRPTPSIPPANRVRRVTGLPSRR